MILLLLYGNLLPLKMFAIGNCLWNVSLQLDELRVVCDILFIHYLYSVSDLSVPSMHSIRGRNICWLVLPSGRFWCALWLFEWHVDEKYGWSLQMHWAANQCCSENYCSMLITYFELYLFYSIKLTISACVDAGQMDQQESLAALHGASQNVSEP